MTTSISSETKQIENKNKVNKRADFQSRINSQENMKPFTCACFLYGLYFCKMHDRPMDKVNYILDAHLYRES